MNSKKTRKLTETDLRSMMAITQAAQTMFADRLGMSYNGERNLYETLGYPVKITYRDYIAKYRRGDIAKAVIDAPVEACWRDMPNITESQDAPTDFETQVASIVKQFKLRNRFVRADRLASLGEFGILFLGLTGVGDVSQDVQRPTKLAYVQPYSQEKVSVAEWQEDTLDERYGLPTLYKIKAGVGKSKRELTVHWRRVIHITQDNLESEIVGLPQLEAVYNRLLNLELVLGGSSEMFWRGGFPGYAFKLDEKARLNPLEEEKAQTEIDKYIHGLRRYMQLSGITVESLDAQVADPSQHVDVLLKIIAGTTGIPMRILLGTEEGRLAGEQDDSHWKLRISERRTQYCEPSIIRQTIDRLVDIGVVTPPQTGEYAVAWSDLVSTGKKEESEIATNKATAIAAYANAIGAEDIVPREVFYREVMHFSEEVIQSIEKIRGAGSIDEPEDTPAADAEGAAGQGAEEGASVA